MHVAHKIFAERYEEQNTEHAAEQRTQEDFKERNRYFGILCLEDVKRRQSENGSCHHYSRRCAYRLHKHVLAKCILALHRVRQSYCYDGNRYGCLKHLSHFQTQVGCRSTKNHRHYKAQAHRIGGHFGIFPIRTEYRLILLAFFQFSEGTLGKFHRQFFFFFVLHNVICFLWLFITIFSSFG